MTYKEFNGGDRMAIFMYVLELDVTEQKKAKILKYLYEEYRITHEMYKDVHEFISGIKEEDLRGFRRQLNA